MPWWVCWSSCSGLVEDRVCVVTFVKFSGDSKVRPGKGTDRTRAELLSMALSLFCMIVKALMRVERHFVV